MGNREYPRFFYQKDELTIRISQVGDDRWRLLLAVFVVLRVSVTTSSVVVGVMVAVETIAGVARQTPAHPAATTAAGVNGGVSTSLGNHLGSEAIVASTTTSVNCHHSLPFTALEQETIVII